MDGRRRGMIHSHRFGGRLATFGDHRDRLHGWHACEYCAKGSRLYRFCSRNCWRFSRDSLHFAWPVMKAARLWKYKVKADADFLALARDKAFILVIAIDSLRSELSREDASRFKWRLAPLVTNRRSTR